MNKIWNLIFFTTRTWKWDTSDVLEAIFVFLKKFKVLVIKKLWFWKKESKFILVSVLENHSKYLIWGCLAFYDLILNVERIDIDTVHVCKRWVMVFKFEPVWILPSFMHTVDKSRHFYYTHILLVDSRGYIVIIAYSENWQEVVARDWSNTNIRYWVLCNFYWLSSIKRELRRLLKSRNTPILLTNLERFYHQLQWHSRYCFYVRWICRYPALNNKVNESVF